MNPSENDCRLHKQMANERMSRMLDPIPFIATDYQRIYEEKQILIGMPGGVELAMGYLARENTVAIIGAQFGDEGKGRILDNVLETSLKNTGVKLAHVVRFQGGANAGHTVYTPDGEKIALHQIPSSINSELAIGIMDSGMSIHMGDLITEIEDAEKAGDLRQRLILSRDAHLITDLERAEEVLNRRRSGGNSDGGTGRGISPAYGNALTRTGKQIKDLMAEDWKTVFGKRYDRYVKEFDVHGYSLSDMDVPDLRKTRDNGKAETRKLGTKEEFLDRLEETRNWYIKRDESQPDKPSMIQNTFVIHRDAFNNPSIAYLFEGAQAVGLHHALGRLPDVTSSDTTVYGILPGTKLWKPGDIKMVMGVGKLTYMSSVGAVKMITDAEEDDPEYVQWVRDKAHEYGTTTGRPRDICSLDLALMRYNIRVGGIEALAMTHLDIARKNVPIKVCTHYERVNENGKTEVVPYQPGIEYQEGVTPIYIELPGWDAQEAQNANSIDDLPLEALQFLSFIQAQTATPIVAVTNGPERDRYIEIPQIEVASRQFPGARPN